MQLEVADWKCDPGSEFSWLVNHNDICVEHGAKIFTSPKSYVRHSRNDFSHYLRNQRSKFESALTHCETCDLHPYDRYFSDRLHGGHSPVKLLDPRPYYIAGRLSAIVGKMAERGDGAVRPSKYAAGIEGSRRFGFDLLNESSRLLEFLSELHADYLRRSLSSRGNGLYGPLQTFLSANLGIPEDRVPGDGVTGGR